MATPIGIAAAGRQAATGYALRELPLICGLTPLPGTSTRLATATFRIYNKFARVTFDPAKREKTLTERGLDFADAMTVFEGTTIEVDDTRKDYGERRIGSYGLLAGRMVVVGYTPRGAVRHVFSMRKANDREKTRLARYFRL